MALTRKVTLELKAQTAVAQARLDAIRVEAERLAELNPTIEVKIREKAALEQMAVLRKELRSAGSESDKLSAKTETLSSKLGQLGKSADNALPGFAGLASAGIALGPAMLPVLAAVTGATIGMGAAIAGAGAALGIFAIAAKSHFAQMHKDLLKVQAANLAANKALATPAGKRTATQKGQIATARQLTAEFQKNYGVLATAQEKFHKAWTAFASTPIVNSALARGLQLLADILPHLTPLLQLGGDAVGAFTGALAGFTVGGGLDKLVAGLVRLGKIGLTGFLAVLHNLAVAFGALSGGAGNFAQGAISGLVKLSAAFASWATNKGPAALSSLMATVRRLGPQVVTLIRSLAAAVPNLVAGISPLAPVSLALAGSLAKLVKNVPPGVITAIAVAFAGWTAAAKGLMAAGALGDAWKAVVKFSAVTKGATIAETVAAAATRAWGLAMDALPWVALAAAVVTVAVLIIKYHKQIWAFVQRVWDAILNVIQGVWGWIKRNWPLLLAILTGPFGLAIKWVVNHWGGITDAAKTVMSWFRTTWMNLTHLLTAPFRAAKKIISGIWKTILGWIHGITGFLGGGGGSVPGGRGHGMGGGSGGANAALARQMVPAWSSGAEWGAWNAVAMRESGWSSTAQNPSGALGIAQALNHGLPGGGGTYGNEYGGWGLSTAAAVQANSGVPQPQIAWMANYIRSSYGDPVGAWNHELSHGWYDKGGYLPRGLSIAANMSGAPERVLSGGQEHRIESLLAELIQVCRQAPHATSRGLGEVLSGAARRSASQARYSAL